MDVEKGKHIVFRSPLNPNLKIGIRTKDRKSGWIGRHGVAHKMMPNTKENVDERISELERKHGSDIKYMYRVIVDDQIAIIASRAELELVSESYLLMKNN